jgi:hypothetical protein
VSSSDEADQVQVLANEQEIRLSLEDGASIDGETKVRASFVQDQAVQITDALRSATSPTTCGSTTPVCSPSCSSASCRSCSSWACCSSS